MANFKLVLNGTFGNGEIWRPAVHFDNASPGADASSFSVAAGVFLDALWSSAAPPGIASIMPESTTLNGGTIYTLDPTSGHATSKALVAGGGPGTSFDLPLPNQVALVITMRTATPGRRGRGRIYLPGGSVVGLLASGRISTFTRDQFVAAMSNALQLTATSGFRPVLFTPGQPNRPITTVDAGDVYDTQRRRRNKLVESRSPTEPATSAASRSVLLPPDDEAV